jgi:hypothetical protein
MEWFRKWEGGCLVVDGGMDLYIMCVHGKAFADIDKYLENGNHVQAKKRLVTVWHV